MSKIIITIVFGLFLLSAQAQQQMLAEAFSEFSSSRFWQYEEVTITWNMKGMVQADMNEGLNSLMEGNMELAEHSFSTVLKQDSTLWQSYYYRGVVRKQLKKFASAQRDLHQSITLHPDFYEGHVEMAKVHFLQGHTIECERVLKKAIQLNPSKPTAYYLKGDINLVQKQLKEARNNYVDCLAVDSLFHDARIKLTLLDLATKKNEAVAMDHLNKVLSYDSLQKSALLFRSILIYDKDKDQCVRDLSNLILVSPNNVMAYYLRGMVFTKLQNYSKAFSDFQKVIKTTEASDNDFVGQQTWMDKKIDIQNVGAYTLTRIYGLSDDDKEKIKQAYCHIITNSFDQSIVILNQTSTPLQEPLVVYLTAVTYEHKGDHNEAFRLYNRALQLDDAIADAHKKRGIYEQELKQWDKSIADLTRVLELNPNAFVTYKIRGISYYLDNRFEKAINDFTMYLEHDSINKEVLSYRGMAYLNSGKRLNAYVDFAQSDNLQAFDFQQMSHLVDSMLMKGDTSLTLSYINKLVTAAPYFTEGYVKKFKIHQAKKEWEIIEKEVNMALVNSREDVNKSDHSYLLTLQAICFVKQRHEEDALKSLDDAIRFDKKNALAYLERGKVWLYKNKASKAEADLRQALALGNKEAKQILASQPGSGN